MSKILIFVVAICKTYNKDWKSYVILLNIITTCTHKYLLNERKTVLSSWDHQGTATRNAPPNLLHKKNIETTPSLTNQHTLILHFSLKKKKKCSK